MGPDVSLEREFPVFSRKNEFLRFGMPRAIHVVRLLLPRSGRGMVKSMSGDSVMTKKLALIVCGLTGLGLGAGPWGGGAEASEHHGHHGHHGHQGHHGHPPQHYGHGGDHSHYRHLPPLPRPAYGVGLRPAPVYYPPPVAGARVVFGNPRFSIGIGFPLVAPVPQYYGPVDDGCYGPYGGW